MFLLYLQYVTIFFHSLEAAVNLKRGLKSMTPRYVYGICGLIEILEYCV